MSINSIVFTTRLDLLNDFGIIIYSIFVAVYHMLKNNVPFYDLGSDFYNKFNREKKICSYLNKLSELGYDLTAVTVSS